MKTLFKVHNTIIDVSLIKVVTTNFSSISATIFIHYAKDMKIEINCKTLSEAETIFNLLHQAWENYDK